MAELNWERLLSTNRFRASSRIEGHGSGQVVVRNPFEADYDRIVGSSSVRRLQDKAQVFPLQEDDVARTRLTHSIEVSGLARSLGKAVGKQLEGKSIFVPEQTEKLAALLQVTGLIHDLGNPPFGHYGETAIREWFKGWFQSSPLLSTNDVVFSNQQKEDFQCFDGNAQNWRIVTRLQTLNDNNGANFTFATLGTIIKYPWRSDQRPEGKEKFGYFKSEEENAEQVREALGLNQNVRHPATYLLEAADDIIYLCDDIEDGVKKGLIEWPREFESIKSNLKKTDSSRIEKLLSEITNKETDWRFPREEKAISGVRNFRNAVQRFLFESAIEQFMKHYGELMSNEASDELLKMELLKCEPDLKALCNELGRVAREYCFTCNEVLSLESAGHKVISSLLDIYVPALIENDGERLTNTKYYPGKLFHRISPNFVYAAMFDYIKEEEKTDDYKLICPKNIDNLHPYDRLRLVVDFVAGMTDSYAFLLYQELMGIKRP